MLIATATIIGLLFPLKIDSDFSEAMQPLNAFNVLSDTSGVGQIKEAISYIAIKYLVEPSEMLKVIECESSFRTKVYGDSGKAYSLCQYHKPTFDAYCSGNYYSPKDQIECMAQMLKAGLGSHWTCWRRYFSK